MTAANFVLNPSYHPSSYLKLVIFKAPGNLKAYIPPPKSSPWTSALVPPRHLAASAAPLGRILGANITPGHTRPDQHPPTLLRRPPKSRSRALPDRPRAMQNGPQHSPKASKTTKNLKNLQNEFQSRWGTPPGFVCGTNMGCIPGLLLSYDVSLKNVYEFVCNFQQVGGIKP